MAVLFDDANTESIYRGEAVKTAYPFTMACWFNADALPSDHALMALCHSGINDRSAIVDVWNDSGSYRVYVRVCNISWSSVCKTGNTFNLNEWNHAAGVFTSNVSRAAYLNGSSASASDPKAMPGCNRTSIGALMRTTGCNWFSGKIAEAAIWNVALSSEQIGVLASGVSPVFVRPSELLAYWPVIRDVSGEWNDRVGGYALDVKKGTPEVDSHCPIIYPAPAQTLPVAGQLGMTPLLLRAIEKY
jgi:hypothetical protein